MKLTPLFLAAGLTLGLAPSTRAALMDNLQGYYPFESQTNGIMADAARAFGYAGFTVDSATLHTPVAVAGSLLYPPWTNSAVYPSATRAGNGALSCQAATAADYAGTTDLPIWNLQSDWAVSVWFKPDIDSADLTNTSNRYFVLETAGTTAPISFGLRGATNTDINGNGLCDFQFYSWLDDGTKPSVDYYVPTNQVNQWHHLVIMYDAEDTSLVTNAYGMMDGYLDDVLVCQIAPTDLFIEYGGFNFGTYRSASGRWWNGQIDEVAMWERLLTTNEIASLYEAGNASESLATLIGSGGDAALLTNYLAAYWGFDGAYAPNTSWVVTNKAVAIGGLGTYETGPANLTLFGGEYGPGTIETYPLTTNAALALVGNGALMGNGSNNYANIGGNPLDPQQDLTVSAWFNPNTGGTGYFQTSTRAFVFETTDPTQTYAPISFGIRGTTVTDTNGNPTCDFQWYGMFTDGTKPSCDFYVPVSQVDQWHYVVQIYRAISANPYTNSMECWLDGVLRTNAFLTKTNVSVTNLLGFNIGTYRTASGRWFNGLIDEVALWQRALSPAEVVQIYTNGLAGKSVISPAPPRILSFKPNTSPAGSFILSWQAQSGFKYAVVASSDLTGWQTALVTGYTTTVSTASIIISPKQPPPAGGYYDPGMNGAAQRFYRVEVAQ